MNRYEIPLKLPSLNEYIEACRSSAHQGARFKRDVEDSILWSMRGRREEITGPVWVRFEWYEESRRRDKDNVAAGKKFILDALQKAGILSGDGNRNIVGFADSFVYGQGQGVVVEIEEAEP